MGQTPAHEENEQRAQRTMPEGHTYISLGAGGTKHSTWADATLGRHVQRIHTLKELPIRDRPWNCTPARQTRDVQWKELGRYAERS